ILDGDGDLVIAKAQHQSYHEISRAPILKGKCWTPPVLAQKRLFARNAAGDLVCIDMRKP
ncbi:MAG: alcohol dehydrogenase, partial [Planctomycetes bacterium]|nr:alcohol dehydrogenase [Planctomycetota bacterium]